MRRIDRDELFPVLYENLLSPAGIWSGFDGTWLYGAVADSLAGRTWLINLWCRILYAMQPKCYAKYWEEIERLC